MSNVDIYTICQELKDLLTGARVDKSYQPTKDTIVIRFHKAGIGRLDLVMQAGKRIHLSVYPLSNPQQPPHFPMLLRNRVRGANVVSVEQHNFDRVVIIKMKKDITYTLIVELFSQGNIILLDEENNIISPLKRKQWSDRDISAKREYIFPPENGINPLTITEDEFNELVKSNDDEIVRVLAKSGLGSLYAEEILLNTSINKKTNCRALSSNEIEEVFKSLKNIFSKLENKEFTPMIVNNEKEVERLKAENPDKKFKVREDVVPISLETYKDFEAKEYDSFNEACDEFFSSKVASEISNVQESAWNKKVDKFSNRLKKQQETLEGFEKTIDDSNRKGETIFTNYVQIENVLNVILDAREKDYGWKEIGKTLKDAKKSGMKEAQIFESLDPLGNIVLNIDGESIAMDCKKSIPDNAEVYYEKAKKAKRKIKGATIAIENTKKQLEEIKSKKDSAMENISVPKKRVKKNLKWYEKLRWFVSSDDVLVVGGRDANSNESVVKKYLEPNDIYLHADIHGATSTAIKLNGHKLNDNLLTESGEFAASFSSAWSKGFTSQDVFWVHPDQVSKTPEAGEFLPKGSFVIRGHRNYIRGARLKLAVGIVDYEGKRIMAGPIEALEKHSQNFVVLKPGFTKKEAIAKKILHKINEDDLITLDDIIRVLPSGKCDIDEEYHQRKKYEKN